MPLSHPSFFFSLFLFQFLILYSGKCLFGLKSIPTLLSLPGLSLQITCSGSFANRSPLRSAQYRRSGEEMSLPLLMVGQLQSDCLTLSFLSLLLAKFLCLSLFQQLMWKLFLLLLISGDLNFPLWIWLFNFPNTFVYSSSPLPSLPSPSPNIPLLHFLLFPSLLSSHLPFSAIPYPAIVFQSFLFSPLLTIVIVTTGEGWHIHTLDCGTHTSAPTPFVVVLVYTWLCVVPWRLHNQLLCYSPKQQNCWDHTATGIKSLILHMLNSQDISTIEPHLSLCNYIKLSLVVRDQVEFLTCYWFSLDIHPCHFFICPFPETGIGDYEGLCFTRIAEGICHQWGFLNSNVINVGTYFIVVFSVFGSYPKSLMWPGGKCWPILD